MRRLISTLFIIISFIFMPEKTLAEDSTYSYDSIKGNSKNIWKDFSDWCFINDVATGLDLGLSIGSMGVGIELKTPVSKWVDLRVGVDWLPKIKVLMSYGLDTYDDGVATGNFNKVAQMVYENTGIEMDPIVEMNGYGSMVNFKLLADVFPIPSNRHWHLTAGFYYGTECLGKAYNTKDEKPTLVGLNVYNRGYEYFTTLTDIFNVPLGNNTYMDPDMVENLQTKFRNYGRMGVRIGDFKDGTPYIMEPAPDGSVSAKAYVNRFKPYLGAGYSTDLDRERKWHFGVNLGVLFWGGAPNVIYYDYSLGKDVSFTHDLVNIRGKVGRNMNIIKSFPVWPVLEISFSYSFL